MIFFFKPEEPSTFCKWHYEWRECRAGTGMRSQSGEQDRVTYVRRMYRAPLWRRGEKKGGERGWTRITLVILFRGGWLYALGNGASSCELRKWGRLLSYFQPFLSHPHMHTHTWSIWVVGMHASQLLLTFLVGGCSGWGRNMFQIWWTIVNFDDNLPKHKNIEIKTFKCGVFTTSSLFWVVQKIKDLY